MTTSPNVVKCIVYTKWDTQREWLGSRCLSRTFIQTVSFNGISSFPLTRERRKERQHMRTRNLTGCSLFCVCFYCLSLFERFVHSFPWDEGCGRFLLRLSLSTTPIQRDQTRCLLITIFHRLPYISFRILTLISPFFLFSRWLTLPFLPGYLGYTPHWGTSKSKQKKTLSSRFANELTCQRLIENFVTAAAMLFRPLREELRWRLKNVKISFTWVVGIALLREIRRQLLLEGCWIHVSSLPISQSWKEHTNSQTDITSLRESREGISVCCVISRNCLCSDKRLLPRANPQLWVWRSGPAKRYERQMGVGRMQWWLAVSQNDTHVHFHKAISIMLNTDLELNSQRSLLMQRKMQTQLLVESTSITMRLEGEWSEAPWIFFANAMASVEAVRLEFAGENLSRLQQWAKSWWKSLTAQHKSWKGRDTDCAQLEEKSRSREERISSSWKSRLTSATEMKHLASLELKDESVMQPHMEWMDVNCFVVDVDIRTLCVKLPIDVIVSLCGDRWKSNARHVWKRLRRQSVTDNCIFQVSFSFILPVFRRNPLPISCENPIVIIDIYQHCVLTQ